MNMEKIKENIIEQGDVEETGPTAWATAYKRSIAEIPLAKEVFEELCPSIESASKEERGYFIKAKESRNTPQIEARFRMINLILEEQSPQQILEIATGLSSRGMAMTEEDSNLRYAELDLPGVMAEKQKIVRELKGKLSLGLENLDLQEGNAMDYKSLIDAVKNFKKEDITIINEGLLRYLTFEQKAQVAKNIYKLLKEFGGAWITPDITLRKVIMTENKGKEYDRILKLTGIDINANSFIDEEHAKIFFEELGFRVECRRLTEVEDELVTPDKIGMEKEEVHETIKDVVIFIMKAK